MENAPVLIPPIQPGHVLVVDDDAPSRQLLKDLLTANGHHVVEAADGEEALAAVRCEPLDVILLDVVMPRMDGFEVCRSLKSNPDTASIHILMITSLSERKDRIRGIECGANDFLNKPVQTDEVLLRVRNAVMSKQMMDELQRNRLADKEENMLLSKLRSTSVADDAGAGLAFLTVGTEMMAWRVQVGHLDPVERNRLYGIYEQLGAVLAKSGAAPA